MNGLWLASSDLRTAVVRLQHSRDTLHSASNANARAAKTLERTIDELKDLRGLHTVADKKRVAENE